VLPGPETAQFRLVAHTIPSGADLITVFGRVPGSVGDQAQEIPLVSVLRDTLGDTDPDNDRLRYVWVHTTARPTLLQHGAALVPFFYFRPDLGKNADKQPVPVIDLAATASPVWTTLAASLTQVMALDPNGAWIRSSTRSYRTDLGDLHRQQLSKALAVLSELNPAPGSSADLSDTDLLEMRTRLALAERPLGGLVSAERLPQAYVKQRMRTEEIRGHNWELLRQRAEANGLYFEPFGVGESPTHAMLWIAKADLSEKRAFDSHFLNIATPYSDARLFNWNGYTAQTYLNGEPVELIPLALYSLDYPKVPLLLADFRAAHAPKRQEMIRRAANDTVSGVLGISKWGNWPYLAGSFMWNFVRTRHGATSDRAARSNAYSEVREWLALDPGLDPDLRTELQKRLELLSTNPLETGISQEADIARRQYQALLKYADNPQGLGARIQHDRNAEVFVSERSLMARTGLRTARIITLGTYSASALPSVDLMAELNRIRRVDRQRRFLEEVAASGPSAEVVWNTDRIKRAVNELVANGFDERSAQLVERIRLLTNDEETRELCDQALESVDAGAGQ
jgi:hypothetical protein